MVAPVLFALAQFTFQVDADEFANTVFHLNCLSSNIPCTKASFQKFWHDDLHWTPADQRQLEAWRDALDDISFREPPGEGTGFLAMASAFHPRQVARRRIIATAFDSHSPADFAKRAAKLGAPAEIARLRSALDHIQTRLHLWWKSTGQAYATRRLGTIRAPMRSPEIMQLAGRIQRFMEVQSTGGTFHVHLIARHDPKSGASLATPVGNHVLLEVVDDIQGHEEFARAVILHEITHTFFDAAPKSLHGDLIRAFLERPEPEAQALYSLLNEGLATAAQSILLDERSVSDKDLYKHPYIPRIGRAAAAPLRDALEHGPTLFHGFLSLYFEAASAEMKEEIVSPRFLLTSAVLVPIGNVDEAEKAYRSEFATTYWASPGDRNRFKEMNMVILTTYDKLEDLAGWDDAIVPLSKAHRAFVFSEPRSSKSHSYLVAGRDDQSAAEAVAKFAAIRTGTKDGLILSVD
jgi:hypothetical protein